MALEQAGDKAAGADVFVTLEPCAHRSVRGPACSDLLAKAGIARLVAGVEDPDLRTAGAGLSRLRDAGVDARLMPCNACNDSLAGYLHRTLLGRPFVTLKLAMSLDGCVALAGGESQWITGEAARVHVHSQRARQDAILVGGGTWRADNPRLDVRLPGLEALSPRRVVLSRQSAFDGVETLGRPEQIAALKDVQYLYIEGGAGTAANFLAADLVDRLEIYRAPIIIGGGLPGISDIGLERLHEAHGRWTIAETRQLGSDRFEAYSRVR